MEVNMKLVLEKGFINENTKTIENYYERLMKAEKLDISRLDAEESVLIVMDMVKGFTDGGNLYSERIGKIKDKVAENMKKCSENGMKVLCFCDCHTMDSAELSSFPPHCITGSGEEEMADELRGICDYKRIDKNSTNGFITPEFQKWLSENEKVKNYIICGDCTDICVMQFAQCAKAWYNNKNIQSRIMILTDSVETYDAPGHPADFMNISALMHMECGGMELYAGLK